MDAIMEREILAQLPSDAESNQAYEANNGPQAVKRAAMAVFGDLLPKLIAEPHQPDGNKASA